MSIVQADAFADEVPPEDSSVDERYTTRETIDWCRRVAGVSGFDLDVAACEESHHAPDWYSKADDGLQLPWFGRVFCNPPFSDLWPWVAKAWVEVRDNPTLSSVAMLIPATRTEQKGWQDLVEPFRDRGHILSTHFLPGRTAFARPGSGGVGQSGAPFGCVLLVFKRTR